MESVAAHRLGLLVMMLAATASGKGGIMAAKLVGRPVKLVTRREQMFGPVGHRAPTRQTIRMGTDAAGGFTAISPAPRSFDR